MTKAKLVAEGLYDRENYDEMTDAEAETLWRIHLQSGEAFDAICEELTASLGHTESQVTDEQRDDIIAEAEELVENFDEADTVGRDPQETTPLIMCLRRHHDICLEIMNIQDVIAARMV